MSESESESEREREGEMIKDALGVVEVDRCFKSRSLSQFPVVSVKGES